MTETENQVAATEKLAKRSTVNHILNCFCCYKAGPKPKGGTVVPHLSSGLESSADGEESWEVRFDEAVSNLARIATERSKVTGECTKCDKNTPSS